MNARSTDQGNSSMLPQIKKSLVLEQFTSDETIEIRVPMDVVVGTLGGLKKLFDEKYLRKNRVAEVGIDEVDTMLDDTFR